MLIRPALAVGDEVRLVLGGQVVPEISGHVGAVDGYAYVWWWQFESEERFEAEPGPDGMFASPKHLDRAVLRVGPPATSADKHQQQGGNNGS